MGISNSTMTTSSAVFHLEIIYRTSDIFKAMGNLLTPLREKLVKLTGLLALALAVLLPFLSPAAFCFWEPKIATVISVVMLVGAPEILLIIAALCLGPVAIQKVKGYKLKHLKW